MLFSLNLMDELFCQVFAKKKVLEHGSVFCGGISRSWKHMQRYASPLEKRAQEMAPGSCTCSVRLACIRPDEECGFTGPCSRADVEPKSKCYGVSPRSVSRPSLLLVPTQFWPSPCSPTCCAPPPAPKPVAGAAASLLGPACLSLPKQPWLMRPWTHPLFPLDLGSPTAE